MAVACHATTVLTDVARMDERRHMDRTTRVVAYRPHTNAVRIIVCQLEDQTCTAVAANTRDSAVARIIRRQHADRSTRVVAVNTHLTVAVRIGLLPPADPISKDARVTLTSLDAVPTALLSPRAPMAKVTTRSTYTYIKFKC